MRQRYPLAGMSAMFAVLTWSVMVVPVALGLAASRAPAPGSRVLYGAAAFVVLLYFAIWFWWRPTRFEIGPAELRLVWPLRERRIARSNISGAAVVSLADVFREFGRGIRLGAGGLFGGFGKLLCPRGTISFYISRTDRLVLVRMRHGDPLLISPATPEAFVTELTAGAAPKT
jgi:hypothetical protein